MHCEQLNKALNFSFKLLNKTKNKNNNRNHLQNLWIFIQSLFGFFYVFFYLNEHRLKELSLYSSLILFYVLLCWHSS